jgi:GAF domain-containing protein
MGGQDPLAEAHETVARQQREIERLQRRLDDARGADDLRQALTLAAAVGAIATPVSHAQLLEIIVETAARVIGAQAASLFLIDQQTEELVFEVALGQKADEVKKFRVPLGHGIAGLVAVSGQPMAISDVANDPRRASDIQQSIGYTPRNILCVPLFYSDQIIGVLELLDKEGSASFSMMDTDTLSMFANLAAVAIEQSRTHQNLAGLVGEVLRSLGGLSPEQRETLRGQARAFAGQLEEDAVYQRALELAELVREISWQGEAELTACQTILRGFATYLRQRPDSRMDLVSWR